MEHKNRYKTSYSRWDLSRQRPVLQRVFLKGVLVGAVAVFLICLLLFLILGPLLFGRPKSPQPESTAVSQAQSVLSAEEPTSAVLFDTQSSPASASVSAASTPVSVVSKPAAAVSKSTSVVTAAVSQAPMKTGTSPLNTKSSSYLIDQGSRQPDSYLADAVFIGDSITQGLGLYLPDVNTTVLGVRSLNPDSVFTAKVKSKDGKQRTIPNAAISYKPKRIYIMIGTNGLAFMSFDHMISQLDKLITTLSKALPDCRIVIEGIPPVSKSKYASDHRFSVKQIDSYNKRLLTLAEKHGIPFLDVNALFRNSAGYIPEDQTPDGIHFYKANYQKWVRYLLSRTVTNGEAKAA